MSSAQSYKFYSHYPSPYSSARERGLLLNAYRAILKLIPKFKNILAYQADADTSYFNDVVEAVRKAHISCDALTYVIQMQEGCNAARSEAIKRIKDNTI
jgi:hypothetical protein